MKNYIVENYEHYREEDRLTTNNARRIDHFAQDGIAPLLSQTIDNWNESEFEIWCHYHYSVCREQSILGASNHVIIIGKKQILC